MAGAMIKFVLLAGIAIPDCSWVMSDCLSRMIKDDVKKAPEAPYFGKQWTVERLFDPTPLGATIFDKDFGKCPK